MNSLELEECVVMRCPRWFARIKPVLCLCFEPVRLGGLVVLRHNNTGVCHGLNI